MSFHTERDGTGTIRVSPRREEDQSGLVIISHGLGDSAEGFADVAEVRDSVMGQVNRKAISCDGFTRLTVVIVSSLLIISIHRFLKQHLASQLPHLKFILPTAPTQPVTMNMGMSVSVTVSI
jgi:lysophospholipase-2